VYAGFCFPPKATLAGRWGKHTRTGFRPETPQRFRKPAFFYEWEDARRFMPGEAGSLVFLQKIWRKQRI